MLGISKQHETDLQVNPIQSDQPHKKEKLKKSSINTDVHWKSVGISLFGEPSSEKHHHKTPKEDKEKAKHKKKSDHHKQKNQIHEIPVQVKEDKTVEAKSHTPLKAVKSSEKKHDSETKHNKHHHIKHHESKHDRSKEKHKEKKLKADQTVQSDTSTVLKTSLSSDHHAQEKKRDKEKPKSLDLSGAVKHSDKDFEKLFKAFCNESKMEDIKPLVSPIKPALAGLLDSLGSKESAKNLSKGMLSDNESPVKNENKEFAVSKLMEFGSTLPGKDSTLNFDDSDVQLKKTKRKRSTSEHDTKDGVKYSSKGTKRIFFSDSDESDSEDDFISSKVHKKKKTDPSSSATDLAASFLPVLQRSFDDPLALKPFKGSDLQDSDPKSSSSKTDNDIEKEIQKSENLHKNEAEKPPKTEALSLPNQIAVDKQSKQQAHSKVKNEDSEEKDKMHNVEPVSYTHLTLPTIYSV